MYFEKWVGERKKSINKKNNSFFLSFLSIQTVTLRLCEFIIYIIFHAHSEQVCVCVCVCVCKCASVCMCCLCSANSLKNIWKTDTRKMNMFTSFYLHFSVVIRKDTTQFLKKWKHHFDRKSYASAMLMDISIKLTRS